MNIIPESEAGSKLQLALIEAQSEEITRKYEILYPLLRVLTDTYMNFLIYRDDHLRKKEIDNIIGPSAFLNLKELFNKKIDLSDEEINSLISQLKDIYSRDIYNILIDDEFNLIELFDKMKAYITVARSMYAPIDDPLFKKYIDLAKNYNYNYIYKLIYPPKEKIMYFHEISGEEESRSLLVGFFYSFHS